MPLKNEIKNALPKIQEIMVVLILWVYSIYGFKRMHYLMFQRLLLNFPISEKKFIVGEISNTICGSTITISSVVTNSSPIVP